MKMSLLTDIERLKTVPSGEVKEQITEKISQFYGQNVFDDKELEIASEVIRLLAHDSEKHIRQILSHNLKNCGSLPRDIALHLANDIAEVAAPMLQYSIVLTQEDLIQIVKSSKQLASLTAIARRKDIQTPLAGALVDTSQEEVVHTLACNHEAEIGSDTFKKILEQFSKSSTVTQALVERGDLPIEIAEKMIQHVSNEMRKKLISDYHIPESVAAELMNDTQEQTTLFLLSNAGKEHQTEALINHLHNTHKLSSSIILRALCKGDLLFFEMGLAKLAGLSHSMAHELIWNHGPAGFASLYKKADLPKGAFNAVNIILQFALQEAKDGTIGDDHYARRMIERITQNGYDKKISIMEYFMVLLKSKVSALDVVKMEE